MGAVVFGVLGLAGVAAGLALPWLSGFASVGCEVAFTSGSAFDFGIWSALWLGAAVALVCLLAAARFRPGSLPVTGPAVVVAAAVALAATAGAQSRIAAAAADAERKVASVGDAGPCDPVAAVAPDGGVFLAELSVLLLVLAVAFAAPRGRRPVLCWGLGAVLSAGAVALIPARGDARWLALTVFAAVSIGLVFLVVRPGGTHRGPLAVVAVAVTAGVLALSTSIEADAVRVTWLVFTVAGATAMCCAAGTALLREKKGLS